ncbi:helix-turn-helix transcriptional regulator [Acrocarpospora phusangensis]|uniref:Helix-turn-helix transcriptional regulator n=1 Tax=Acrocarpospora phusangensis TaxID=1070424 RepID=A0A919QJ08_9ACTN|nr:LuxR C-terminal-related transcriptional regulator [Acrocarpospora phusangensis]GIH28543.1 helix-turn-helix transcriptional regulator [Acrocarpospora phusangensis]
MEELSLAVTKLRPPPPPGQLVRRSRLDDVLDAGVDGQARLILVSAPAGSGKSTLVASWSTGRPENVAWLQAEASDSDPARFWSYLVAAIGKVHPIAVDLEPVVAGSNGDDFVVVSALVNALADVAVPLVVVIDDYHLIGNGSVQRGVERLVELCPYQVTIVISTRIDPPFRLGRLRVRGQLAEIRGADLRFDTDEASGLLGSAVRSLDRALLDQLCDRAEGWAAGLVLAGLSLERAADPGEFIEAFRGDDQLIVEYLRDEFLATVDKDDLRRLLETSIPEQLSGALVDFVTGTTGGAKWLSDTAGRNQLLIGLDRTRTWFRYHHLLRDLLRLEAHQTFPERIPELHARAAEWFESQGDLGQAIVHRLAGGEVHQAAQLLLFHGPRLLAGGQTETLRSFLDQLGDVAKTLTGCALFYGWCEFIDGRYSLAQDWLDTMDDVAPEDFDRTPAMSLRINISLARGDVATALDDARRVTATDQLISFPCDLATITGVTYAWAGQAEEARRVLRLAVDKAAAERFRTAHVVALVHQAVVDFNDESAASAHHAAAAALDAAQKFGLAAYHVVAPAYAIRARTGGDPARARADALEAVNLARRACIDLGLGFVLTVCGDTLVGQGDPAGMPLLAEARSVLARCPDPGIAGRHLARAESRHGLTEVRGSRVAVLVEQLTERELAVLRYLPATMSQRDIASELYVSLNTVKTHCRAIYRKLGVADRKAAIQAARDLNLL